MTLRPSANPRLLRLTAAISLLAFALASTGYPLWSPSDGKDLSRPFPCMFRQCGCRNADQCWRGCCCFTNREKLAWARKNKVQTPEFVVTAAKNEEARKEVAGCCSKKGACGRSMAKSSTRRPQEKESTILADASSLVTAFVGALTCHSSLEQWVAIGAVDVPHVAPWELDLPPTDTLLIRSESSAWVAHCPASPPPWC